MDFAGDFDRAPTQSERAIAPNPDNALGLAVHGIVLLRSGDPDFAVAPLERALRLDPNPISIRPVSLGYAHCLTGRFDAAAAVIERFSHGFDEDRAGLIIAAAPFGQLGRAEKAADSARRVTGLNPSFDAGTFVRNVDRAAHRAASPEGLRLAGLDD